MLKSVSPLGRSFQMDQVTVGAGFNPTLGNHFKKRWIVLQLIARYLIRNQVC